MNGDPVPVVPSIGERLPSLGDVLGIGVDHVDFKLASLGELICETSLLSVEDKSKTGTRSGLGDDLIGESLVGFG